MFWNIILGKTIKSKTEYSIDESIEHLLKLKVFKAVVGEDYCLEHKNKHELEKFFQVFPYSKCYDQICRNLGFFVKFNLTDFHNRLQKLRATPKNSEAWHHLQMGEAGVAIFRAKYVDNIKLRTKSPSTRSSKAALNFFKEIETNLRRAGFSGRILYEDKETNNHEFRIQDKVTQKWYCYDFTIKDLNVIIEYHGEHCHPRAEQLGSVWRHLYTNESAEVVYQRDQLKEKIANNKGYHFEIVWHGENRNEKVQRITQLLLTRTYDKPL